MSKTEKLETRVLRIEKIIDLMDIESTVFKDPILLDSTTPMSVLEDIAKEEKRIENEKGI